MRILRHPVKKLTRLTVFAGGYVLGARAGRERYEQIREVADQVLSDPRVRQATDWFEARRSKDVQDSTADESADWAREAFDGPSSTPTPDDAEPVSSSPTHRLLVDEHIESEDELVYSTGPDIEETIDELADVDGAEVTVTERS